MLTLLGPQRLQPTLAATVERLALDGRIATITAGWQEREAELDELREHLELPVVDLELHRRCEQVFAEDPDLFRAHRARQDRLRAMHRLYRYRLDFQMQPARELLRRTGDLELLEPEREAAIDALRRLDHDYLKRIAAVHRTFTREHPPGRHRALERQRDKVAALLADCAALTIAGGHVAVLVNRLRLFRVAELAADLPVIAWSAGAMALAERIVLFHDSPPQGAGNAEVLDLGLGLAPGLVPLPHARRRLQLEDPHRVELFARRFAPAICLVLEEGSSISFDGRRWRADEPAQRLSTAGMVEDLEAA